MVGAEWFEHSTSCSQSRRATKQRTSTDWQVDYLLQHSLKGNVTFWHYGQSFRPEQLIPNVNGVANFILLRAEKAKLEAKA